MKKFAFLFALIVAVLFGDFAEAQAPKVPAGGAPQVRRVVNVNRTTVVNRGGLPFVGGFRAGLGFRAASAVASFVSPFGYGGAAFVAPQAVYAPQAFAAPYARQRLIVQQYAAPQEIIQQYVAPQVQQVVTPDCGCDAGVVPQSLRLRVRTGY